MLSVEPYGMKPANACSVAPAAAPTFSALGRAVWDETASSSACVWPVAALSVLSVEPYGMKPTGLDLAAGDVAAFSALGRAVWDETPPYREKWVKTVKIFQCSRSSRMG